MTDHGTAFVRFARDQWRLAEMLRRIAGATDRIRDGLTHWLTPLTGAYYVVPAVEALGRFTPDSEERATATEPGPSRIPPGRPLCGG